MKNHLLINDFHLWLHHFLVDHFTHVQNIVIHDKQYNIVYIYAPDNWDSGLMLDILKMGVLGAYGMHCKRNYKRFHPYFCAISKNMRILLMGQHYC